MGCENGNPVGLEKESPGLDTGAPPFKKEVVLRNTTRCLSNPVLPTTATPPFKPRALHAWEIGRRL